MPTMRLFVYGTLLEDSATPLAHWLLTRVRAVRRASVPGRLFAIMTADGCYPALVPGRPDDRVHGAVCELPQRSGDLARLDRYEGREYRRWTTRALLTPTCGAASRVAAQVYVWCAPLPPSARWIASGDFLGWLARHDIRAYAPRGRF